jgi:ATP-binding cassette, subfamily C, bacterial CydD
MSAEIMATSSAAIPAVPNAHDTRVAGWLAGTATRGRRAFVISAALLSITTLFRIGTWAGIALLAQGLLDRDRILGGLGIGFLIGFGAFSSLTAWGAEKAGAVGWRAVACHVRGQLVATLLPDRRRTHEPEPAPTALAMVELAQDVADYHALTIPQRLSMPASMIAVLLVTAAVHWPAAIVLLLSSALIPLNMRLAGRFTQQGADRRLVAMQRLNAMVLDSFRGMRTLRSIGAVHRRRERLVESADRLNTASMSVLRRVFLSGTVVDVVITFSIAVNATYIGLTLLGDLGVPGAPPLTLAGGLFVLLVCPMYFAPLRAMAAGYHERERATAAATAIVEILGADDPVPGDGAGPTPLVDTAVEVNLLEVTVRYDGADHEALAVDHLRIQAGRWTAITGSSGAGKTTLLSVIAGARIPTTGHVSWSTTTTIQPPELGACAWIGQHTVLLDATVRDNIRLGRPDAPGRAVERAVAAAGLEDVVARLPAGLDTRLGEAGWGVSTGEARRIAIARAFLRGARLWVLDEPTAHLDLDAERHVIRALREATRDCTVIIATHSAPVAARAETVLVVEDGRIRRAASAGVA